jgi:hypothetical protein
MNIEDLSYTIIPKSDQLNADDLIAGPLTITIAGVRSLNSKEQPVALDIDGRMPYKPCLTMRRALISAWGKDGSKWVGRSLTLYCDPTVRFGPNAVGGIRISHISHIDSPLVILLTTSRARRTEFTFQPLVIPNYNKLIERYNELNEEGKKEAWAKLSIEQKNAIMTSGK